MKLVCVMDGTVPVLIARLLAEDGWNENREDAYGGEVYVVELAVPGGPQPPTWAVVDVNENGGVDGASGAVGMLDAIRRLSEMCDVPLDAITTVEEDKHYAATYHEGTDEESYAHAVKL